MPNPNRWKKSTTEASPDPKQPDQTLIVGTVDTESGYAMILRDLNKRRFRLSPRYIRQDVLGYTFGLAYRPPSGRFEIAGWVRNMANKAYKTFAFDASTFNQTTIYFVGDPRTYGATLNITF